MSLADKYINQLKKIKKMVQVFSKVFRTVEHEDHDETVEVKGNYCLLEPVTREWHGDLNRGLARYLHDDLDKFISKIQYHYENGFIVFDITFSKKYSPSTIVSYRGKDMSLYQAACEYISGQISDGWGENGIILHNWCSDEIIFGYCSYKLYEKDYDASLKLAKENGQEYASFDKYPVYKEIEF